VSSTPEIDILLSRMAIQDSLSAYCRGIDRLDEHLIASAYWPDAREDHGIFQGTAREFAPWIVKFLDATFLSTVHHLGQSSVTLRGDRAAAETYFSSIHRRRAPDGSVYEAVDGRYVDIFEKRGASWKISSRLVIVDFMREFVQSVSHFERIPGLTIGARGHGDKSYSGLFP
jgi:SnoaL-like domain